MTKRPPAAEPVNFFEAVRYGFEYGFQFKGTASRSEFWYWTLFYLLVQVLFQGAVYFEFFTVKQSQGLAILLTIIIILPTLSLWIRRARDASLQEIWVPELLIFLVFLQPVLQIIENFQTASINQNPYNTDSIPLLSDINQIVFPLTTIMILLLLLTLGLSKSKEKSR